MQLQHIPLDRLTISSANMRNSKKAPEIGDILPSVRSRGIIVPLLVRQNGEPDHFEIVAGRRRYFAASKVAEETSDAAPLPCAVLEAGDDAAAVEASLIENVIRVAPNEVTQWTTFVRLVKEGRTIEEIAATFATSELRVRRILALGNLLPRLRSLYAQEKIDVATVRHLTLASPDQQRDWLKLYDNPETYAPRAHQLKGWLFGGAAIPTTVALFPLEQYTGTIVADLFGDDSYFADTEQFWRLQRAVIDDKRQGFLDAGWSAVEVLEPGKRFESWTHLKVPRGKGGRVYMEVSARGELTLHEGYLPEKEVRRKKAQEAPKPTRTGMTSTLRNYVDLHRHAAVRAKLLDHPDLALRLAVAHAIAGSHLWSLRPDTQLAAKEGTAKSLADSVSEQRFTEARRAVLEKLGLPGDATHLVGSERGEEACLILFDRLLGLPEKEVHAILAIVMGETLAVGSLAVAEVGTRLGVNMAEMWQADAAFFELIREKETLLGMVEEVAGPAVAKSNVGENGKALKQIIQDCLAGVGGRERKGEWAPGCLVFN